VLAQRRRDGKRDAMVRASRNATKAPKGKKGRAAKASADIDAVWG